MSDGHPTDLKSVLRARAARNPQALAHVFLEDGESKESRQSFGDLDRQARTIASALQEQVRPGDRVLILYPPGLEYISGFFGAIYAGAIPVPVYPPDLSRAERSLPRLAAVLEDCRPSLVLTLSPIEAMAAGLIEAQLPRFAGLRWLSTDALSWTIADGWREPALDPGGPAFLQYTSGSTGAPKGVVVSHANIAANIRMLHGVAMFDAPGMRVSWLPPYHDMGLIGVILGNLFHGQPVCLMSPIHFLARPMRWLEVVSRLSAIGTVAPNFAFDLCVRKATPEAVARLSLGSLRVIINGAEPIRARTLDAFCRTFEPCGFSRAAICPAYGLAEATLAVTAALRPGGPRTISVDRDALEIERRARAAGAGGGDDGRAQVLVPSGAPLPGVDVRAVEPESRRELPPGSIGEIWVRGAAVAGGYWDKPEESERAFAAVLATGEGPFLRTGDLGFLDEHGDLVVTGRIKDLVIIRGRNHAPADIEATAELAHPAVRPGCAAAFSVEGDDGAEALAVVAETGASATEVAAVADAVRRAIAERHQVEPLAVVLLAPHGTHKTSSGKLQRGAIRRAYLAGELAPVLSWRADPAAADPAPGEAAPSFREALAAMEPEARRRALEAYLTLQISRFGDLPAGDVDLEFPPSLFVSDSLRLAEMAGKVERDLQIDFAARQISIVQLFEVSTRELVSRLLQSLPGHSP